ncbi:MAG: sigma-70 family RNA polymerase sigma factor [Planctomycetota bacterium]|jgi:RNA polymerase sigma factor for flagellar operon FliA
MRTVHRRGSKAGGRRFNGVAGKRSGGGEALLSRYHDVASVKLRNRLVERYRSQVEDMARGLSARLPRSVDVQDLTHAGMWGLIQAIENYRPGRGSGFVPFMRIRVRGAMLDELRNMDYLPRLYRSRVRALEEAQDRLKGELMRTPTDAELAQELGMSEEAYREQFSSLAAIHKAAPHNRLHRGGQDEAGPADIIASLADHEQEEPLEAANRRELLAKIEASLEPVEWAVLRLHYLEGMTGKEVARKLSLSQSRICQIHMRVLSRLKIRLAD